MITFNEFLESVDLDEVNAEKEKYIIGKKEQRQKDAEFTLINKLNSKKGNEKSAYLKALRKVLQSKKRILKPVKAYK